MVTLLNRPVRAILLNDVNREAGSNEFNGRIINWEAGYVITCLPYGEKRGESIRKYVVSPPAVKGIQSLLANVSWGSLIELIIDDKKVVDCKVLFDMSQVLPID